MQATRCEFALPLALASGQRRTWAAPLPQPGFAGRMTRSKWGMMVRWGKLPMKSDTSDSTQMVGIRDPQRRTSLSEGSMQCHISSSGPICRRRGRKRLKICQVHFEKLGCSDAR